MGSHLYIQHFGTAIDRTARLRRLTIANPAVAKPIRSKTSEGKARFPILQHRFVCMETVRGQRENARKCSRAHGDHQQQA